MTIFKNYHRIILSALLTVGFLAFADVAAMATDAKGTEVYGVAIKGYDPVAYFTENRAVKGSSDDITQDIITDLSKFRDLAVKVDQTERILAMNKSTDSLEAYDYYLQAYYHFFQRTRDGHIEARKLFQKAIKLDPNYAAAYVGLAKVRTWAVNYGWTEFPNVALQEALDLAKKAVQLDDSNASAHGELGYIYMRFGEYDLVESELQKAIDLNPNDWISYRHIGAVLLYAGQPAESLEWYTKVLEFDPYLSPGVYMNIGIGYYLNGDDDQAIHWLKQAATKWPTFLGCHILLAPIYGQTGQMDPGEANKKAQLEALVFSLCDPPRLTSRAHSHLCRPNLG